METVIDNYCSETRKFFKDLAIELGQPQGLNHAMRVTRAVLHTLRRHITPEESLLLVADLPMILKGIYVDAWDISQPTVGSGTMESFLEQLRLADTAAAADFSDDDTARHKIRTVFNMLKQYVNDGELNRVAAELPRDIVSLLAA